jgi:hypothetical protein
MGCGVCFVLQKTQILSMSCGVVWCGVVDYVLFSFVYVCVWCDGACISTLIKAKLESNLWDPLIKISSKNCTNLYEDGNVHDKVMRKPHT